jgi:hypothetical protein
LEESKFLIMVKKLRKLERNARFSKGLSFRIIPRHSHSCGHDFDDAVREYPKSSRIGRQSLVIIMLCYSWLWTSPAFAQSRQSGEEVKTESEIQLRVSTSSAKFYSGEVVPLDLAFTSTIPKRYQINLASYDRSGRMGYEEFTIEPKEGIRDPLHLYFNSINAFLMGGLTSFEFLSASPTVIHLNLNEWVRFDRPGVYRFQVVSHRVGDSAATNQSWGNGVEIKSNWIELKIIAPDPSWQKKTLAEIRQELDAGKPINPNAPDKVKDAALTQLRYLGTEEAARELARRLRGEDNNTDFQCMFGLIGSPHRDAGLAEMNRLFEEPDFPITQTFLTAMSILPLNPTDESGTLQSEMEAHRESLNQRLISILPSKRGKASATSLNAVLVVNNKMSSETRKELLPELIRAFTSLKVDQQAFWLEYRWDAVKDPEWLPLLRTLALQYTDFPGLRISDAYESLELTGAALRRWYELDPEGARDAVIKEIIRPKPRYNATLLGLLPDRTLPELEHVIAEHFLDADNYEIEGNLASLLFRYADSEVMYEVQGKVTEKVGTWACDPQNKMLAYLLHVDPATAEPLIERAIAARGGQNNACRHMLFIDIGSVHTDPVLERLAIKSLSDADPEVVSNAASFLGRYGSANAEQPLWQRFEEWSKEWTGREQELRYVHGAENPNVWQKGLGETLAGALATGAGWLSDESKISRIKELAVGPDVAQNMDGVLNALSQRPLAILCWQTSSRPAPYSFTVAQYQLDSLEALKTKLSQFPPGTTFVWSPSELESSEVMANFFKELSEFSTQHGIRLQHAPAPPPSVN